MRTSGSTVQWIRSRRANALRLDEPGFAGGVQLSVEGCESRTEPDGESHFGRERARFSSENRSLISHRSTLNSMERGPTKFDQKSKFMTVSNAPR